MRHTVSHEDLQPPQHDRIREHSSDSANQRIDRETRGAIDDALRSSEARRGALVCASSTRSGTSTAR
jgi:hypothetical protein